MKKETGQHALRATTFTATLFQKKDGLGVEKKKGKWAHETCAGIDKEDDEYLCDFCH